MSIEMRVDPRFWDKEGNYVKVSVSGDTVRDCLEEFVRQDGSLKKEVFDKAGNLNMATQLFLNEKQVFSHLLKAPVKDGDYAMLVFAGGKC